MSVALRVSLSFVAALVGLAVGPAARAQTYAAFANTSSAISFDGLFVGISNCSYTLSGTAQTSCATDGLNLEQIADGNGKVELEIVPTTGSALYSAATGGLTSVNYTLTLSTNAPSTAKVTSYALSTTGVNTNGTTNNFFNTVSGYSEVAASIAQNAAVANCTQGGYGTSPTISCVQALSPTSSLSINGGLAISGATTTGFTLSSASFLFTTVPEPASLSLLAAGVGALAMACRRRRLSVTKP